MMTRKINFMPYWKVEEMRYEEAKVEDKDGFVRRLYFITRVINRWSKLNMKYGMRRCVVGIHSLSIGTTILQKSEYLLFRNGNTRRTKNKLL